METFDRDVAVSTVNFTCTTRSAVAPAAATEVSNAGLAVAVVVVAGVLVAGAAAAGGVVSPGVDEAQPIGSRMSDSPESTWIPISSLHGFLLHCR
jgi:hypothetical protein